MSTSKVAVVTGGNKGIGLAIVKALCSKYNGDVFLTARNIDLGQEAVKKLEAEGLKVKFHQLDINDEESIKQLGTDIQASHGGIDVLVNNAGMAYKGADTTPFATQAKVTLQTNFFGTLNACKILMPIVKPGGRVVNVSSFVSKSTLQKCSGELQKIYRSDTITEEKLCSMMNEFIEAAQTDKHGALGYPNTAYGVSKLGVTVMTRIHAKLMREQGKNDVLVNACCPGWVRTDMAGPKATKSPEEGAETPVYLALLPEGATEPHGQFVSDKKVQEW
uniref:carbonyl reductase (NADPH) n=1 Tax=Phallusia mammillata TaxID=59560 RepID=A0A6F9D7N8_9ASCI|nr:carbonyl reductase [NADPH] 1-like [Phallusia mammillata]